MPDAELRPRRSMLYTPATRPDRVEKALTMDPGPDVLVADLEDAVPPDEKDQAREAAVDALSGFEGDRPEACLRVNPIHSDWFLDDVEAAGEAAPDAVVVPKVESPGQLRSLEGRLAEAEHESDLDEGSILALVQLETARGVAHALDIGEAAAAVDRVTALVFGADDYAATVGARRTDSNHEVAYARSRVALAAGLGEVDPIDQLYNDYEDLDGLGEEARAGRDLGFVGKQIIHPDQIGPVHEAFTPSDEEVDEARDLLDAVEEAEVGEGGVIAYQGRMIDRPFIEHARHVVRLAEALDLG
jgi:citrate lyase beta subunit